ncbi:MAG: hypothetical protein JNJ73_04065 [Hyphomonadaceae bacterium]|nr:hypothetical protein [Hyphomonadaceae bacterium]
MAALAPLLHVETDAPVLFPRIDLRTGLVASGALGPQPNLEALGQALKSARRAWRGAGFVAPLSAPLWRVDLDAEWLDDVAREAGCTPHSLSFELDETQMQRAGPALAVALRARGWGVTLNTDPDCPLPFGKHARSLYTEILLDAPDQVDPYLALDACTHSPLGRRIFAAKEAGIMVTARTVNDDATASLLALAGFDRAGGKVAAQA